MLLQEVAGLRQEVSAVTSNLTAELDQVTQQRNKQIAELQVSQHVCMHV